MDVSSPSIEYDDFGIHPETNGWTLLSFITAVSPTLEYGPTSPNGNFTQIPMEWSVNGHGTLASVTSLTISGKVAVLSGVIQSGFTGSITANAVSGYDISIVADEDFSEWQPLYDLGWSLIVDNGVQSTFTGTIIKYVSIPAPSHTTQSDDEVYVRAFDFPLRFTENCDMPKTTDDKAISSNIRSSIMISQKGIPIRIHYGSNISQFVFESDLSIAGIIGREALKAVARLEPRAVLDPNPLISESNDTVNLKFTYYVTSSTGRWKTVNIPISKISG